MSVLALAEFLASTATRVERGRSVRFEWTVKALPAKDGYGDRKVVAVLSISHTKAGINYWNGEYTTEDYFGVVLRNETVEDHTSTGFTSNAFMVGSGVGIGRIPAGNRYSAKKLREATDTGYAMFREFVENGDERVLRYLAGEEVID